MVKYTHLIERCNSFLRTGVAWRLKEHGYTFSEAYWRLREGKGLLSAYDKESFRMWGNLITSVRRNTAAAGRLKPEDLSKLKNKRDKILNMMEEYRNKLELGSTPHYLHDGTSPIVVEHLLAIMIGDTRNASMVQQQEIWEQLDVEMLKADAALCMKEIENYTKEYQSADTHKKESMQNPEDWSKSIFGAKFVKDKVWQIRTGHDTRSSVNAEINKKLNFIWEIPNLTNNTHREIYKLNRNILDAYKAWKEKKFSNSTDYAQMLRKIHDVLDSIEIPKLE